MKKGFTLIELLAVIVILAIIALIASPIVVGLIEDSNKQAAERSTEAVVQAAKTEFAVSKLNGTTPAGNVAGLDLDNEPTDGTVEYGTNGEITLTGVQFGKYTCTYNFPAGTKAACTKTP